MTRSYLINSRAVVATALSRRAFRRGRPDRAGRLQQFHPARDIYQITSRSYIIIATLILVVLPIALAQSDKVKEQKDDLTMRMPSSADDSKSIVIHQEIDFTASPQRIYEALLDAKQFTAFSGKKAEINREVGGAFSVFQGHIIGRNLELIPNQRIVQAWRVVTWPEGVYSIARFELQAQGSGTHLVFDHIGFPEGLHDHLAEGWETNYWELLKKYFH